MSSGACHLKSQHDEVDDAFPEHEVAAKNVAMAAIVGKDAGHALELVPVVLNVIEHVLNKAVQRVLRFDQIVEKVNRLEVVSETVGDELQMTVPRFHVHAIEQADVVNVLLRVDVVDSPFRGDGAKLFSVGRHSVTFYRNISANSRSMSEFTSSAVPPFAPFSASLSASSLYVFPLWPLTH